MNGGQGAQAADRVAGWGFLGTVAAAPLLFGGHAPLAWGLNAAVVGVLLVLHSAVHGGRGEAAAGAEPGFEFLFAVMVAVCLWIYLQSAGWTPEALWSPIWARASQALGEDVGGAISVNPGETRMALLRLLTALGCGWLGLHYGRDPVCARRIVTVVAVSGCAYVLYGLSLKAANSPTVLWLTKSRYDFPDHLTATFVNPNSFAAYAGMALACAFALFLRALRVGLEVEGLTGARRQAARSLAVIRVTAVHSLLLFPLLAGLILSRSRACIVLTVLACAALLGMEHARNWIMARSGWRMSGWGLRRTLFVLALGGAAGVLLMAEHGDQLAGKLAGADGSEIRMRLLVAWSGLRAAAASPFLGWGYGTFADVFPSFRDEALTPSGVFLEAHNAYVEVLLGLGVPAAVLFLGALGFMVYRCFYGALTRRRDHLAPAAAAASTIVIALHGLVDFSIQLEGVAMTYAALLGAGFAQSWSTQSQNFRQEVRHTDGKRMGRRR